MSYESDLDLDDHTARPRSRGGFSHGIASSNPKVQHRKRPKPRQVFTSANKATTTDAYVCVAANPNRIYLMIQNKGAASVFLGFGNASIENAVELKVGTQYDFSSGIVPQNDIYCISGGVTGTPFVVVEGNEQY